MQCWALIADKALWSQVSHVFPIHGYCYSWSAEHEVGAAKGMAIPFAASTCAPLSAAHVQTYAHKHSAEHEQQPETQGGCSRHAQGHDGKGDASPSMLSWIKICLLRVCLS